MSILEVVSATNLVDVANAVTAEIFRAITGKLFTEEQIRAVTTNAVGKHFAEWLPKIGADKAAHDRVEEARGHIATASAIITDMQAELNAQTGQLDKLLVEIEEEKKVAERYADLAATKQEQISAIRAEMEEALRRELVAQSEKGKTPRRIASAGLWLATLLLGVYFKDLYAWAVAHAHAVAHFQ